MIINKNNYEAFFLDYHEGNLSPQQVADLLLFVEQHPELKEEFESFENVTLDDLSNVAFEGKSSLKKEITLENKEEYFIRYVENTLTPAESTLLKSFIKQHPQFLPELELFKKTKVFADASVVFENKESLKRDLTPALSTSSVRLRRTPSPKEKEMTPDKQKWDDLLIASIEGNLSNEENIFLNQQLSVDAETQHNLNLYKQTKLIADVTVVYEGKEELKRKERRLIPFYYYVAAAASIALLLFFFFNNGKTKEQNFADNDKVKTIPVENSNTNSAVKNNEVINTNAIAPIQTAVVVKHKNNTVIGVRKDSVIKTPIIVNESPIIPIAENKNKNEETPQILPIIKNEQPTSTNSNALASNQEKTNTKTAPTEFLSLRELAAQKIKEKTLDEESLAVQKKNGRSKRFTGWDLAQIVTRGISKVTGRNVEVKPTYNDDGDVTAYALGGGFQVSRGK